MRRNRHSLISSRPLWVLAMLSLAPLRPASAASLDATIVTLEGEERPDKLQGVADDALIFQSGKIAMKEIAEVRFAAEKPEESAQATLHLRNGDELKAAILSGDDAKLKLKTACAGDIELENKYLNAIVFKIKDGPAADAIDAFVKAAPAKEDLLLLPKGDTLSGFLEKFTDKEISFNAGGQSRVFAFTAVAGFRLAPLDDFKQPAEFRATVMLRDDSRLTGRIAAVKDKAIVLQAINGKPWDLDAAAVRSFVFVGGRLVYLSDEKPSAAEEKPYVGGMPRVFGWRRDQSVTGDKLSIGGKTYARGIGVHSFTRLAYDLNGQYARLLCDVGMDAGAASNATCAWRVQVDGKIVKSGQAKPAQPAESIRIDLAGAKTLELICDYGADADDAGDHLDWANARLIKP